MSLGSPCRSQHATISSCKGLSEDRKSEAMRRRPDLHAAESAALSVADTLLASEVRKRCSLKRCGAVVFATGRVRAGTKGIVGYLAHGA